MFKQVNVKKMEEVVASLKYLVFSYDEIHFYAVQDWCGLLVLNFL
jgi:hypothetical protein